MGLCVRLALARLAARCAVLTVVLSLLAATGGCRGGFSRTYEYEEDIHLSLDGSATIYVNSSVPALVALRGADLPLDPRARLDRNDVRAVFESPATRVANVSLSRRDGRRYVHVRIEAPDIRQVSTAAPFAWSTYALESRSDLFVYKQQLGASAGKDVGDVGWTGGELVAVRLHLPSRVTFQNQQNVAIQRGNIIPWEQPLTARMAGEPLSIEVHMEQDSILFKTLGLFGLMIVLVVLTFALVIWLVMRRGRIDDLATKPSKTT
jgi:hypothetical protein